MIIENEREFIFTDENFTQVRQLMFKFSGVNISEAKRNMVYSRLSKRLRDLSLQDFSHYLKQVKQSSREQAHFVNALTTNLTAFFREQHHFSAVEQYLQKHNRSINIWSAGCSSGEEPYSLAITAIKARNSFSPKVRILASDINSEVLRFAKKGVYNLEDVDKLPSTIKQSFFFKGKKKQIGKAKIIPDVKGIVAFKNINLFSAEWQLPGMFDIIFCRNVLIYFKPKEKERIIRQMLTHLKTGGLLVVGHSENYSHLTQELISVGQTIYQKR